MSEQIQIRSAYIGDLKIGGDKGYIDISGPCAYEDAEQAEMAKNIAMRGEADVLRMSLYKPRTEPGEGAVYYGIQEAGIPHLAEISRNIAVATEVITDEQANAVLKGVLERNPEARVLLWIGSRNQNQVMIDKIARIVADTPEASIMAKNQPWPNENHWRGIYKYLRAGGVPHDRIILCHRGFDLGDNGELRNTPYHEMAMRVRAETGAVMVYDPSHTAGRRDLVLNQALQAIAHRSELKGVSELQGYDGLVTEVHPLHRQPHTDPKQQINEREYNELLVRTGLRRLRMAV